jgi:hypothetical protein
MLALGAVIPLPAGCPSASGSKRVWMTSVALFGAGSALCGLAWSAESLIFFRILQGLGGGMIMPVGMSVLAQTAGPHRVGRVMSVVGMPMLLGPILGPVIGGLIVDTASWRWIFYVNVPIAVLSLVLAARLLHADAGRADAGRLDWLGLALLSPGVAAIVFGLSETETHGGITEPIAWAPIVVGALLVAAFVWHAGARAAPAARRAPVPRARVRRRGGDDVPARRLAVRRNDHHAALLPDRPRRVGAGRRPADGAPGPRRGAGDAVRGPVGGPRRRRPRGGRRAADRGVGTLPFVFITGHSSYWLLGGILVLRGLGSVPR